MFYNISCNSKVYCLMDEICFWILFMSLYWDMKKKIEKKKRNFIYCVIKM